MSAIGVFATTFLPGCAKEKPKGDIEKLQGVWQVVSAKQMGNSALTDERVELTFHGHALTMRCGNKSPSQGIKITLDPSKEPKTIDMEPTENAHGDKKGPVAQGIYSITGDTLTLCYATYGVKTRPKDFSTNSQKEYFMLILKRTDSHELPSRDHKTRRLLPMPTSDRELFNIGTAPPRDRWLLSASPGSFRNLLSANDNDANTAALADPSVQKPHLTVDLGTIALFNMVAIDHGHEDLGFSGQLSLSTSMDGKQFITRHIQSGTRRVTNVLIVTPVLARYIRLTSLSPGPKPWSIAEINLQ